VTVNDLCYWHGYGTTLVGSRVEQGDVSENEDYLSDRFRLGRVAAVAWSGLRWRGISEAQQTTRTDQLNVVALSDGAP
jgi:hypothetical protein